MATYKDIAGTKIQNVAGDPANPIGGQIWFNSSSNTLKGLVPDAPGGWATIPSINTGRGSGSGAGTASSAIFMAGYTPTLPSPEASAYTETFNGTSWNSETSSSTNRIGPAGAGANSESAMVFGGTTGPGAGLSQVEVYNGSSWTEVNETVNPRDALGNSGAGTVTDAIYAGGRGPSNLAETWNGTSWTSISNLLAARTSPTVVGTSTAALLYMGASSPTPDPNRINTESWNGSAWTEVNNMNTGRSEGFGAGTQTAAVGNGGGSPNSAATELWNGTSWSPTTNSPSANSSGGSSKAGTSSSFIKFGSGSPPFNYAAEWTGPGPATVTFSSS